MAARGRDSTWRFVWALAGAGALSACGPNVVVDGPYARGSGGAGTTTGAAGATTTGPTTDCGDTTSDPNNCGACGHSCLGGDCQAGFCRPIVLASKGYPNGIAIDAANVYWTDLITGVMRIPKGGGMAAMLAPANAPEAIVLDANYVYWTAKNSLQRSALAGGTPASLFSAMLDTGPFALAADATDLYWADRTAGILFKMPLAGGSPTVLAKGLIAPDGVVVDDANVYFANGTNNQTDGAVLSLPKGGGPTTMLAVSQHGPNALAFDDTSIYWTDSAPYVPNPTGLVSKVPKGGGPSTVLAAGQGNPLGIAIDDTTVYWVNSDSGTVMRVPKAGGMPETLSNGQQYATGIAVDAQAIYWTTQKNGGAVLKLAK